MAYDKELDIAQMERAFSTANGTLTIGIYSYNGGEPKLRIVRQQTRKDKTTGADYLAPSKLGGLSIAEAVALKSSFLEAFAVCDRLQQTNAAPQPTAPKIPTAQQIAQPVAPNMVAQPQMMIQPVSPNVITLPPKQLPVLNAAATRRIRI